MYHEAQEELARRGFVIMRSERIEEELAGYGVEVLGLDMGHLPEPASDGQWHRPYFIRPAAEMQKGHGARYVPLWAFAIDRAYPRSAGEALLAAEGLFFTPTQRELVFRAALSDRDLAEAIEATFILGGRGAVIQLLDSVVGAAGSR